MACRYCCQKCGKPILDREPCCRQWHGHRDQALNLSYVWVHCPHCRQMARLSVSVVPSVFGLR